MYNIPLFDLNYDEDEVEAAVETIRSKWISMGAKNLELEKEFADMLGAKYAFAVTNCTAALHLACVVAGLKDGDEVICPSLTFAATVNCIKYVNATPVFVDICGKDNITIDPAKIEELITDKTKAIIPMHYAGFAADMDAIMAIAKKHNLVVIEDACHGPLSEYKGKKLGTIGAMGCFSFFSNKNISTGEGGMIVTNDDAMAEKIKLLRSHGMTTMSYQRAQGHATSYDILEVGFNYRMDDIRASLAISQLKKLKPDLEKRVFIRKKYESLLSNIDGIVVPFCNRTEFSSNYIFPVVLDEKYVGKRDLVREKLQEKGIQTSVHYPAIHRFSVYKEYARSLPNTEYIADNEFTLPMYGSLTDDQIEYICETLRVILNDLS